MIRSTPRFCLTALALAVALSGCSRSNSPGAGNDIDQPANGPVVSRYDMANRCFVLKADSAYTVRSGSKFVANGSNAADAERFYMKPAGLGRYIFYTPDRMLMTGSGSAVSATSSPADGSDWTVEGDEGRYTAAITGVGSPLSRASDGTLQTGGKASTLNFEPAEGCSEYPEMPTGIAAKSFTGPSAGDKVIGFAEVHTHMAMGSDMSDGSGNRGPSAGGVMYGHAIDRFGVTEALKNCAVMHGPLGVLSAENIILDQNPTETHDTVGWPTFIGWPKPDSQLHQQMYYKWLERAWKSGLRTMTIHGTSIEALCNIAKLTVGNKTADCVDMGVGTKQVEYLYDIQNYVDAQEGGPGKGWFRIVKDPGEARNVIAKGKLAVIPGLEFSNLFHCRVQFIPGVGETSQCTKEDIDREVDEAWDLGVRQIFPFHDVDSALGGTGIFSSILNYIGFTDVHGFWKTYACDDGGEGPKFFYEAGAVLETGAVTQYTDVITKAITDFTSAGGLLPVYGPGRQCNLRTVTPLGQYAIDKIMRKGFVLDIDHAEIKSKQYMLDQGARSKPNYPMVSGHGGHGGINNAQAAQIVKQGGIIYPALPNGKDYVSFVKKLKPIWEANTSRPLSIGYGADANGLRNLPNPRGAGNKGAISYPFTLFQGPGWGPQYAAAGIKPLKVEMLAIPGGQSWNMDEVGAAHYGMVADIVEEARIEGGEEATNALFNSAEAYLELWEQTKKASSAYRKLPEPAVLPALPVLPAP